MAMTGQDWLDYFQNLRQPKRKADWLDTAAGIAGAAGGFMVGGPAGAMAGYSLGKSVGDVGENAVNHTLTPGNVTADAMGAIPGVQQLGGLNQQQELMKFLMANPGVLHMAGGGMAMAPPPDVLAAIQQAMAQKPQQPDATDPFASATPQSMAGPPPTPTPLAQPSHPGWEAASAILGDVLAKLPAPRATRSSNKTIGAYLPAIGAAVSGPGEYAAKQREAKNAPIQKANSELDVEYQKRISDMARILAEHKAGKWASKNSPENAPLAPEMLKSMNAPAWVKDKASLATFMANKARDNQSLNTLFDNMRQLKDVSQFPDIRDAYQKVASMASSGTGISDMSLIFQYMRILDPTSTVREGEYARAAETASLPQYIVNMYNKALNGSFLNEKQRSEFANQAKRLYEQKREYYRRSMGLLKKQAAFYGLDPSIVLPDYEVSGSWNPGAPSSAEPGAAPDPNVQVDANGLPIYGNLKPEVVGPKKGAVK